MSLFDYPALQEVCAGWPHVAVTSDPTGSSTLGRLRQVLASMLRGSADSLADLVPLVRQAMLQRRRDGANESLTVPVTTGWPSAAQWEAAGFDVWETSGCIQLKVTAPRLDWLGDGANLFDDAFDEVLSPATPRVPMDPFLSMATHLERYLSAGQREALRALFQLPDGMTLLANLPTGSGKSLLGQAAALIDGGLGKMTLVVVPTVALAMDQTRRMAQMLRRLDPGGEYDTLAYHGGVSKQDRTTIRQAITNGSQRILFASPESVTGSLRDPLEQAARSGYLRTIVIDEAHLVVGWGDGFRPAFQLLPAFVRKVRELSGDRAVRVALASATLTSNTTRVLQHLFGPPELTYMVAGVQLRTEPRYWLHQVADASEQRARVMEAIHVAPRPFILYVTEPSQANLWHRQLLAHGYRRLGLFHGKTPDAERERVVAGWAAGELDGVVATSAFGLGVDKDDVRVIIHATLPESLDRFYQEVGRGGRDGRACASLLVFEPEDIPLAAGIASPTFISNENGIERWEIMRRSAVQDVSDPGLFWLDVTLRPPHLQQDSKANQGWNLRTLTLMARAGLIELCALDAGETGADVASVVEQLRRAAVRILHPGHSDPEVFDQALDRARFETFGSSDRGLDLMLRVARDRLEISRVLSSIYSLHLPGAVVGVVPACSGCPGDWSSRHTDQQLFQPPLVPRIERMGRRDVRKWLHQWPMASANTMFVSFDPARYDADAPAKLIELLVDALPLHSVLLPKGGSHKLKSAVFARLHQHAHRVIFVDQFGRADHQVLRGAINEVRVVLVDPEEPFPDSFWMSDCALQVVLLPRSMADPHHPHRRLLDTRLHINYEDFVARLIG
jgi:ATP-dependent DNA helicase RecQ